MKLSALTFAFRTVRESAKALRFTFAFAALLILGVTLSAQTYQATALQSLGRGNPVNGLTVALGINDAGTVVGTSMLPGRDHSRHACYWLPNGTVQDIGTLGGDYGVGFAINNLGQIAGSASPAGNIGTDPFLWTQAGGMQDLGRLGTGLQNETHGINDSAQVVGFSCLDQYGTCHAFLWTQARGMRDLGTLGGTFSEANGINAAGHVTGWSDLADGSQHAFLWTPETGMQDIEPAGTTQYLGEAINDSDQIVGSFVSPDDNEFHGFIWTATGGLQDLGTIPGGWSEALAINNSGDVVGFSRNAPNGEGFGVIWKGAGAIQELGQMLLKRKKSLSEAALGINASGQIAANGKKPYLVTPQAKK